MHTRSDIDADKGQTQAIDDLAFIARLTCFAYLTEMVTAWQGYISSYRTFALTPVFPFLAVLPQQLEWLIYFAQVALLIGLFIKPRNRLMASALLLLTLLCILRDLLLLQPYTYMYAYVFLICSAWPGTPQARIKALQIMVCGVYFWAGFHKLNATFFFSVFTWFVDPIYSASTPLAILSEQIVKILAFVTPVYELLIGILLLFPRYRRIGTFMAFIMLIVVLFCLGPLGHNWNAIVWPWNIYLFMLDVRLFLKPTLLARKTEVFSDLGKPQLLSIFLFMAAPALAIIAPWYTPLGFKLYTGNIDMAEIQFAPDETFEHMPLHLKTLISPQRILTLVDWSTYETSMTAPTAGPLVLKQGAKGACKYLSDPGHAILRYYNAPPFYSTRSDTSEVLLCQ